MHTLFDFITHVKGVEYVLAISFILGFILLWELLKARPFSTLAAAARDDLAYLKGTGYGSAMRSAGRVVAAPFIGLAYVAVLPLGFFLALAIGVVNAAGRLAGADSSFGWSPVEAYFAGRKRPEKTGRTDEKETRG